MLAKSTSNLNDLANAKKAEYQIAEPFPHIVLERFFDIGFLNNVLNEFPDLSKKDQIEYDNPREKKLAGKGDELFGEGTKTLMSFLNSAKFLQFLQILTGIEEPLIGDPYYDGGGLHEIKNGGLLKIHADFNKHPKLKLDRRINVLVYLNKNWEESYGGHFELWDKSMTSCAKKILPLFNRMVIFSTTADSYHGHPDPLTCPDHMSRKSLALYYYTNGRPKHEIDLAHKHHGTLFQKRSGNHEDKKALAARGFKEVLLDFIPPIVLRQYHKLSK